ncbi:2-oxoglutarate oxidoreductase subunit KorA [bacterium BMS3Bbin10]|nr:2-oxoglutarate oxidoreductase subunit KorA [bacterium BMS3Bbin10]
MSETALAAERQGTDKAQPLVVRFAGDSGDGIQLAGYEFAKSTADARSDFMTFPDFPAEIRAPTGTLFGVSAFQIQFGADEVLTPGDRADVLVAFNPAALATNLQNLKPGGVLIVDETHFDARGLKKAKLDVNPLEDRTLDGYQVITVDVEKRTLEALKSLELGRKQAVRAKNFWVLGLVYWMFARPLGKTQDWLNVKFKKTPAVARANIMAMKAGHAYGETLEISAVPDLTAPRVAKHKGASRIISGARAMALGLAAVAALGRRDIVFCSYPITPASTLLHALARLEGGVRTFQAEDEIAAATAAIGASFAGSLGVTASSGPGLSLKTEALGLGVAVELPLIVIDVQRGGPSTGMPTKPEQSDLTMAIHGRHGEAPLPVLAPATPDDCFWIMIEAARIAIETMSPVIVLTDAYLANAASDWEIPDIDNVPDIDRPRVKPDGEGEFRPFARDPLTLARPWVAPGTPGHAHRIGGLEKAKGSGHISYDPANHAEMTRARAEKISRIADRLPAIEMEDGVQDGDILIIGWGSTHGSIAQAVKELNAEGARVSHVHLRHLWPLPRGLEALIRCFPRAVTAELNTGQLSSILRSEYLAPVTCISQVNGQPFYVSDLKAEITRRLETCVHE